MTDSRPSSPAEPIEECCKCAAYLNIILHITEEREKFRKEIHELATFMKAHSAMAMRTIGEKP